MLPSTQRQSTIQQCDVTSADIGKRMVDAEGTPVKPYSALAVSFRAFCLESRTAFCAGWSVGTSFRAARVAARAFISAARIDGRMPLRISGFTYLAPAGRNSLMGALSMTKRVLYGLD